MQIDLTYCRIINSEPPGARKLFDIFINFVRVGDALLLFFPTAYALREELLLPSFVNWCSASCCTGIYSYSFTVNNAFLRFEFCRIRFIPPRTFATTTDVYHRATNSAKNARSRRASRDYDHRNLHLLNVSVTTKLGHLNRVVEIRAAYIYCEGNCFECHCNVGAVPQNVWWGTQLESNSA